MNEIIPIPEIQQRIHAVRGKRVIFDADLARFYGVATRELNKAVSRNLSRFPEDFCFQLTLRETRNLMFQFGTSSSQHGGTRRPMRVFTEQGVAMLASAIANLFETIRQLLTSPEPDHQRKIGFNREEPQTS